MDIRNPHIGVEFSKALQKSYEYYVNTLLAHLYTMTKSGV